MAEKMDQPEDERLQCQLCQEEYKDPVLLPCLHSFCKKCLVGEREQQGSLEDKLKCPTCPESFDVPPGGISAFPKNRSLARLVEVAAYKRKMSSGDEIPCDRCVKRPNSFAVVFCCDCCFFLCQSCKQDHEWWRETIKHELVKLGTKVSTSSDDEKKLFKIVPKPLYCSKHSEEKLKFYCEQCEELACRDCVVIDHREHCIKDHKTIAQSGRDEIAKSVAKSKEVTRSLDEMIRQGEQMIERIKRRESEVKEEINTSFDLVVKAVEGRRKAFLSETSSVACGKISVIQVQLEFFIELKESLLHAEKFATNALENQAALEEILGMKKSINHRIEAIIEKYSMETMERIRENDVIMASANPSTLVETIEKFGSIGTIDFSVNIFETGFAIQTATVGIERKFAISLHYTTGSLIKSIPASNMLLVTLKDPNGQESQIANFIQEADNDVVSFSCTPTVCGEHSLSIMINGSHLHNSPFRLWVNNPGNYGTLSNQMSFNVGRTVNGVAVHTNGDVYVSDTNGRISVFRADGTLQQTFGSQGSGNGQFNSPWGMIILNGILYVSDNGNHRVQKLSLNGDYIGQFGTHGSGQDEFNNPQGITHDGNGQILVADYNNHRVQIFDASGSFLKALDCERNTPSDVAVDNDGNIHVTYYGAHTVQIFTPEGRPLTRYSNGHFHNPFGIAIDDRGFRAITSQYRHKAVCHYLHILNSSGQQVNRLSFSSYCRSVAIDQDGAVYIAVQNGCVIKYNNKH